MLTQEPTPEMINKWKEIYHEYKDKLHPNKKSANEIIEYLKQKYSMTEIYDEKWKQIVCDNILLNDFYSRKLSGKMPEAIVYSINNSGDGKILYENQDEIFKGINIVVGVEQETSTFMVEGSSWLWDELCAFVGLDEEDLNNFYLVAEYITCLKKFDKSI